MLAIKIIIYIVVFLVFLWTMYENIYGLGKKDNIGRALTGLGTGMMGVLLGALTIMLGLSIS